MAQIARAILFANAMATSILGFLISILESHEFSVIVFRPSEFKRDMAPMISSLLMSACSAFDMCPSCSIPPDECCDDTFSLVSLVSAGLGIGFAPEWVQDLPNRGFELKKVRGIAFRISPGVAWTAKTRRLPVTTSLISPDHWRGRAGEVGEYTAEREVRAQAGLRSQRLRQSRYRSSHGTRGRGAVGPASAAHR